jgi:hypothetical protein
VLDIEIFNPLAGLPNIFYECCRTSSMTFHIKTIKFIWLLSAVYSKYRTVLKEDDVDSVSALLGDLVSYRAAGASHLEVLAGVALLRQGNPKMSPEEFQPAPVALLKEAAILHPYAVAAYTGPLLDVGRHPLTFPCAWLYRQGVLTPWNRSRSALQIA